MIRIRQADQRGRFDHGWLDARHTFSFGDYHDPEHLHFRALRVINEDRVQPSQGFPTHGHQDMEIITYVLHGELAHKDSMGSTATITPGEVQVMSAGTGVTHSEFNGGDDDIVHLLQIWIMPRRKGTEPRYEQKAFAEADRNNQMRLVVSGDGRDGSLTIDQDALIYASLIEPGATVTHRLDDGRHAWLQVARGTITLNGKQLAAGDGAAISDETELQIHAQEHAELLLFDLS